MPRRLALEVLVELDDRRRTLDHVLETRQTAMNRMARRDRALAHALIYGVLRWRLRLDAIIAACLTAPGRRMPPDIHNILRLGVYQLCAMDRIPASAAVHTAVELARTSGKPKLSGFINAVLRQAQRSGLNALADDRPGGPADRLSMDHAMPLWMAERWIARYGTEESVALCQAMNTEAPLVGRANTLRTSRQDLLNALQAEGIDARPTERAPEGIRLCGLDGPVGGLAAVAGGDMRIQDEGAQLISYMLSPSPGEIVLDACAGRGGKTAHMAQLMADRGRILALDAAVDRLAVLQRDMADQGITCVAARQVDLDEGVPALPPGTFDRVMLDAPCSGMGVIRRNPDTKWARRPDDLARYAARQRRFLSHLAPLVKPSGVLVYAVCSLEPEENDEVVTDFLNRHPAFSLHRPPDATGTPLAGMLDASGFFRSTPHRHGMDGFFAATLVRNA